MTMMPDRPLLFRITGASQAREPQGRGPQGNSLRVGSGNIQHSQPRRQTLCSLAYRHGFGVTGAAALSEALKSNATVTSLQ
jgi:hypothetical protein